MRKRTVYVLLEVVGSICLRLPCGLEERSTRLADIIVAHAWSAQLCCDCIFLLHVLVQRITECMCVHSVRVYSRDRLPSRTASYPVKDQIHDVLKVKVEVI
jgi:hypothetical protein